MPRKSTPAARLKALIASLTADLSPNGEPLTDAEAAFVELAAACAMRAKAIAESIGRGEKVDDAELVRLTNTASRIVRDLRDTKDRRAANVAAAGLTPLQAFAADFAARKAAEPVPEDDDSGFEPVELMAEAVQTPSAPEPIADDEPIAPPKPKPAMTVCFDHSPRGPGVPDGKTLLEIIAELPPNAIVTLTTPHVRREGMSVEDVARECGPQAWLLKGSERLIGRRDWFLR